MNGREEDEGDRTRVVGEPALPPLFEELEKPWADKVGVKQYKPLRQRVLSSAAFAHKAWFLKSPEEGEHQGHIRSFLGEAKRRLGKMETETSVLLRENEPGKVLNALETSAEKEIERLDARGLASTVQKHLEKRDRYVQEVFGEKSGRITEDIRGLWVRSKETLPDKTNEYENAKLMEEQLFVQELLLSRVAAAENKNEAFKQELKRMKESKNIFEFAGDAAKNPAQLLAYNAKMLEKELESGPLKERAKELAKLITDLKTRNEFDKTHLLTLNKIRLAALMEERKGGGKTPRPKAEVEPLAKREASVTAAPGKGAGAVVPEEKGPDSLEWTPGPKEPPPLSRTDVKMLLEEHAKEAEARSKTERARELGRLEEQHKNLRQQYGTLLDEMKNLKESAARKEKEAEGREGERREKLKEIERRLYEIADALKNTDKEITKALEGKAREKEAGEAAGKAGGGLVRIEGSIPVRVTLPAPAPAAAAPGGGAAKEEEWMQKNFLTWGAVVVVAILVMLLVLSII